MNTVNTKVSELKSKTVLLKYKIVLLRSKNVIAKLEKNVDYCLNIKV